MSSPSCNTCSFQYIENYLSNSEILSVRSICLALRRCINRHVKKVTKNHGPMKRPELVTGVQSIYRSMLADSAKAVGLDSSILARVLQSSLQFTGEEKQAAMQLLTIICNTICQ